MLLPYALQLRATEIALATIPSIILPAAYPSPHPSPARGEPAQLAHLAQFRVNASPAEAKKKAGLLRDRLLRFVQARDWLTSPGRTSRP
ncbi:hypothetical protein U6L76_12155, partial [Cutibacterium acnes]